MAGCASASKGLKGLGVAASPLCPWEPVWLPGSTVHREWQRVLRYPQPSQGGPCSFPIWWAGQGALL